MVNKIPVKDHGNLRYIYGMEYLAWVKQMESLEQAYAVVGRVCARSNLCTEALLRRNLVPVLMKILVASEDWKDGLQEGVLDIVYKTHPQIRPESDNWCPAG